jgi:hypothetical protein
MTEIELAKAIQENRIPKDSLSNPWDLGFGMLPVTVLFLSTIILLGHQTNPIPVKTELILFVVTGVMFGIAVYFLLGDRKLKSHWTQKKVSQNRKLIQETLRRLEWTFEEDPLGVFYAEIPFIFGQPGHLLILIPLDNEILFNCRNLGTSKGRMPFLFGIDTLKEIKFRREMEKTMHNTRL